MLFSTPVFVVGFLPAVFAGFLLIGRVSGRRAALMWILAASMFFYGWWKPVMLPLLIGSILVNFALGKTVRGHRGWLTVALTFNLGLLAFFKYAGLLAGVAGIILPLGISFFTFQQIMFQVDTFRGEAPAAGFLDYACFVAFFPHLIAGPIVRPTEIIPQFSKLQPGLGWRQNLAGGLEIFLLGLAKKLVLADGLARFADPGFAAAGRGAPLSLVEAWTALLAYALQIYFDFSGYSDMAIGLAQMFGIKFPLNFNSPYQARDISDFWRRWNMTLSGFLRVYLYIPLGGNRHGEARRIINLMVTMLLGGLWHGAALRFVLWGGLHGMFLVLHGWWRRLGLKMPALVSWMLTLFAVNLAWVPFRATSFAAAMEMYRGLFGLNGFALPAMLMHKLPMLHHVAHSVPGLAYLGEARSLSLLQGTLFLALGWAIALLLPELHSMNRGRRSVALAASFAFSMQALFFAPYSLPFLYFQF
jgi:alginate O-acetyltransferase complex protein AlgI